MREPEIPEAYVRVWLTTLTLADEVLESVNDESLSDIDVLYLGSALVSFTRDVPPEDRCHLLFGFRGSQIDRAVEFVNTRDGVDASRTQVLEVETLLVSRTAPGEPFDLFDPPE